MVSDLDLESTVDDAPHGVVFDRPRWLTPDAFGRPLASRLERLHKKYMGKLIDHYGDFQRSTVTCRRCFWSGLGSAMTSGETFGDGVDKECPQCGERWAFVQWSIAVADDPPEGWEANIGRVED